MAAKAQYTKHLIVNYETITASLLELLSRRYPYGYDEEDVIRFQKPTGEKVAAIPLATEDTYYLIKVGVEMDEKMALYRDEESDASLPEEEYDGRDEEDTS